VGAYVSPSDSQEEALGLAACGGTERNCLGEVEGAEASSMVIRGIFEVLI